MYKIVRRNKRKPYDPIIEKVISENLSCFQAEARSFQLNQISRKYNLGCIFVIDFME